MGILDWFKNRPGQYDPDRVSDELVQWGVEKAMTLTNPRLKLLPTCQKRLTPAVATTIEFLRAQARALPAVRPVSSTSLVSRSGLAGFLRRAFGYTAGNQECGNTNAGPDGLPVCLRTQPNASGADRSFPAPVRDADSCAGGCRAGRRTGRPPPRSVVAARAASAGPPRPSALRKPAASHDPSGTIRRGRNGRATGRGWRSRGCRCRPSSGCGSATAMRPRQHLEAVTGAEEDQAVGTGGKARKLISFSVMNTRSTCGSSGQSSRRRG
jgi:hypothetical protein